MAECSLTSCKQAHFLIGSHTMPEQHIQSAHSDFVELVSWCFNPSQPHTHTQIISGLKTNFDLPPSYSVYKPSQPQKIISGLKTNLNLSLSYSVYWSLNHKSLLSLSLSLFLPSNNSLSKYFTKRSIQKNTQKKHNNKEINTTTTHLLSIVHINLSRRVKSLPTILIYKP